MLYAAPFPIECALAERRSSCQGANVSEVARLSLFVVGILEIEVRRMRKNEIQRRCHDQSLEVGHMAAQRP
jgi:hypothetical protein